MPAANRSRTSRPTIPSAKPEVAILLRRIFNTFVIGAYSYFRGSRATACIVAAAWLMHILLATLIVLAVAASVLSPLPYFLDGVDLRIIAGAIYLGLYVVILLRLDRILEGPSFDTSTYARGMTFFVATVGGALAWFLFSLALIARFVARVS